MVQSLRNQWLSRFACTKAAAGFGRRGAFSWCKADVINGFSRFACTKGAASFRRRGAFSWCKADVINGFPGLLAPSPPPVSGGVAHFLGAKPTQSMAFPVCLHQGRRRFRAARRIFLVQSRRNQWLFPVCLHQRRRQFQAARRIFLVQSRRNQWLSRFACTKAAGFGGGTGRDASYFFRGFPFAPVRFRNSCLRFPASSLRFRFAVLGFITEKPKKPRGSLLRA